MTARHSRQILQTLSVVLLGIMAAAPPAWADDTGPFSPLTFQDGVEMNEPGRAYQLRLRFRSQNWVVLRSAGLDSADLASVAAQPRRLRLRMSGWVHSPQWFYSVQFGFTRSDMDWDGTGVPNVLRDATLGYRLHPDLQFSFGQTKLPGNRQRVVSSGDQQFPDRSVANRDYTLDRDFGLQMLAAAHPWGSVAQLKLAVSGGEGRNPTTGTSGLAYTARAEWLPMGAFSAGGDYSEGDLAREIKPKLSVAAGVHFNRGAMRTQGTLGAAMAQARDLQSAFGDAVIKWRGAALSVEYIRRDCDQPLVKLANGKDGAVLVGAAWNAQLSYLWTDALETALRATQSSPAAEVAALSPKTQQYALGISYYLMRHRVKFQADATQEILTQPGHDRSGAWIARLNTEFGI